MTKEEVNQTQVTQILDEYGLNWEVKKEPLVIVTEGFIPLRWLGDADSAIEKTEYFATTRQDTRKHFASVKDGYEIFQNKELVELALRVCDELDSRVIKCGSFGDGAHVYIQIERPSAYVNNAEVERIITVINSHDATKSLRWGMGNRTIGCMNMYWSLYKSLNNNIRHTENMRDMVEESMKVIESMEDEDDRMMHMFGLFAKRYVTPTDIRDVIKFVTGVDQFLSKEIAEKDSSPQAVRKSEELMGCIASEMNEKGTTLWGLFSGVTYYTTHVAGTDKNREKNKMMGEAQGTDNKVYEFIKNMV